MTSCHPARSVIVNCENNLDSRSARANPILSIMITCSWLTLSDYIQNRPPLSPITIFMYRISDYRSVFRL